MAEHARVIASSSEKGGMDPSPNSHRHLARWVFFVFSLTFIASRVLVILIMTHKIPDFFLFVGETHVHHLNYGIFLLSAVGAMLLFMQLSEPQKRWIACVYGFSMALTFDEFGMWLHLGGSYWQRASYDAVIVLAALLCLIGFAPRRKRIGPHHYVALGFTIAAVTVFAWLSIKSLNLVDHKVGERLRDLEAQSIR